MLRIVQFGLVAMDRLGLAGLVAMDWLGVAGPGAARRIGGGWVVWASPIGMERTGPGRSRVDCRNGMAWRAWASRWGRQGSCGCEVTGNETFRHVSGEGTRRLGLSQG